MKTKIAIIGCGSWGTALAQVLADNGVFVTMVGKDQTVIADINHHCAPTKYFPDHVALPKTIAATDQLSAVLQDPAIEMVLLSVPSQAVREVLTSMVPFLNRKIILVNTAKGFDPLTNERLSETIRKVIPKKFIGGVASLIGPSHAEEVILRQLTLVAAVSKNLPIAEKISQLFSNDYFRVYVQQDEVGSEIGAAMKNVIAIASGVVTGLKLGDNARAALVTRGLTELMRLGKVLGGKLKTHTGLTGLGDLIVTCYSHHSRNYQAGVQIGKDDSAENFLATNEQTVEGVMFAKIAHQLAKIYRLKLPIIEAVYAVLYEKKRPSDLVKILMNRPLKVE
jgi:glycerol-3-phosphate dehydrogenase (NAD(P)+)